METLRWTQIMFAVGGICLRPFTSTPFKWFIYNVYIIIGKILLCALLIAQILDIVFNVENQDEFSENFAISSTVFMITLKYIVLSARRVNILYLIEKLNRNLFMPANKQEMDIRMKFNRIIELTTKAYTVVIAIFASGMFLITIVVDFKGRKLVGRVWLPYDYSSTTLYLITSISQFLAAIFGVSINIACECLYAGLTLHVCCQFEILEHRFKNLDGKDICAVNRCASHHHHIYEYATMINNEFKKIMSCQFFMSISVLCLNLFRMLIAQNFSDFVEAVMYMVCMFSQIFYYCFHGNMVKTKSIDFSDEIFGSDWPSWNDNSKKILLMVIRRSKTPIEFTSMHVVSLNLESFMSLVKTSYSAFNLMTSR
ncbi:odorant receptor Or2-like isoform X2 [Megachile rotundata]|uniref:odorant receptor Or2-like isoform X2 n=1 Tax=Megachile rotundata TaxID=143995 RepID=UPI003FD27624